MMFETELARDESRWLIVSDNPEQLSFTAGGGKTKQWLYNVAIELASYPNPRFRVLVWHENDTTEAKYVHVVAQAAGPKVRDHEPPSTGEHPKHWSSFCDWALHCQSPTLRLVGGG